MRAKSFLIALVAMMLPMVVSAEAVDIDGINYEINKVSQEACAIGYSRTVNFSGEIVIPSIVTYQGVMYKVTSIGEKAFHTTKITSIHIPPTVSTIGFKAFFGSEGIESVHITDMKAWCSINFIEYVDDYSSNPLCYGGHLYLNGEEVRDLVIPNGIKSIKMAFAGCSGLTSVTIPDGVTSIEKYAFYLCRDLTSVTIPNSVTSIGNYAFESCRGLTSVTIPNSVTSIGGYAFSGCSGLTSFTIGNSVKSIGERAIQGCKSLTSINIPNSVTSIGDGAFQACRGLTSVTIPASVTSIGKGIFTYCRDLNSINVEEGNRKYDSRDNCNGVIRTESNTLIAGCKNTVIPSSVTSIGESTFYGFTGLTSITIPSSVTSIGEWAFSDCRGLTSVTIPASVTSIGTSAFFQCSSLISVTCMAKDVPSVNGSYKSLGFDITQATLYVFKSSAEKYKSTEPWSRFGKIIALEQSTYTLTYMVDGKVYKTLEYKKGENISPEEEPQKDGYIFSGWENLPEEMPDEDVTVYGSFSIGIYTLSYIVDGEAYKSYDVVFHSRIIREPEPTKEGYTFSGWSNIPSTMPSHDVTVTGTFVGNAPEKCAAPTVSLSDGEITFSCETEGVIYHYDIKCLDDKNGEGNNIKLTSTYRVGVYASKAGYEDSDVVSKLITFKRGDLNYDGEVDVADHVELTKIIMSDKTQSDVSGTE